MNKQPNEYICAIVEDSPGNFEVVTPGDVLRGGQSEGISWPDGKYGGFGYLSVGGAVGASPEKFRQLVGEVITSLKQAPDQPATLNLIQAELNIRGYSVERVPAASRELVININLVLDDLVIYHK